MLAVGGAGRSRRRVRWRAPLLTVAVVASVVVVLVGVVGLLPLRATTAPIDLGGWAAPWWVGVVLVAAVSTALAYLTGIVAVGRLGSRLASFVGLSEVLFAVLGAWWLVAQRPTAMQVPGGVLVVAAIALIRWAEPPEARDLAGCPGPTG